MRKRGMLCLACVFFSMMSVVGQNALQLKGKVMEWSGKTVKLYWFDDSGLLLKDSTQVASDGSFRFAFNGAYGIYRLKHNEAIVDVMLDRPQVEFQVNGPVDGGEISFQKSGSNNLFHYYRGEIKHLEKSLEAVKRVKDSLEAINENTRELKREYGELRKDWKRLVQNLWIDHKESWPARMAIGEVDVATGVDVNGDERRIYRQKHFFDYLDFTDTVLLKSPLFYHKLEEFLEVSRLDEKIANQEDKDVQKVIDQLFYEAEVNLHSQERVTNFLLKRYPIDKYPDLFFRIADAYRFLNTCEYTLGSKMMQNRIRNSQVMMRSGTMPNPVLPGLNERGVERLSDVSGQVILVVIWSANCPHSISLLDRLKSLYEEYHEKGFEIVAISIDNSKDFWRQTLEERAYYWLNACDLDGLRSETADLFNVFTTPSMILMDEDMNVLLHPLTFYQVEKKLETYLK